MIYDLTLTTAPASDFIVDETLYEHLRLETSGSPAAPADSATVAIYKAAAQSYLDGPAGILGRALVTQTWTLTLPAFPVYTAPQLWLPLPPLQSVASITYIDGDGAEQTLASSAYNVVLRGERPGYVAPSFGATWPATRKQESAVSVQFVAGYGDPADVPRNVVAAGLLVAADLYDHKSAQTDMRTYENPTVDRLVAPLRVSAWGFGA